MRIIADGHLRDYWRRHAGAEQGLVHWRDTVRAANWKSMQDVGRSFSKAKVLNGERVRFEIHGGNFRLIASFNFRKQLVFVKFIGTHAEYNAIDALTVEMF